MATNYVKSKDPVTSVTGRIGEHGAQRTAVPVLLFSENFDDTTLDTTRWTAVTANGGTNTISGGKLQQATTTHASGSAKIHTNDIEFSPLCGTELLLRAYIAYGTDGAASNLRAVGFEDSAGNNKVYLEYNGTTLSACIDSGGSNIESEPITSPDPDGQAYMEVEIYASQNAARVVINGVQKASFDITTSTDPTTVLYENTVWRAYIENTNSGGSTNHTFNVAQLGVWMIGDVWSGPSRQIIYNAAADGLIVRGAGILESAITAATAGQSWRVFDNVSAASGRIVAQGGTNTAHSFGPWWFANGLYFDHVSGSANTMAFSVRGA